MSEKLTPQQKMAVNDRGGRLLVSAAAGSGKTKVLVDRLISYFMDAADPANVDDFLIITYTKAAAAELRGKIAARMTECISEDPDNRHLQRQLQRLYLAKISTVHSFCADILREHAYRLDIAGDFRVVEETEALALQLRILEKILNESYDNASSDSDFTSFIDTQGFGRDDRMIPEIVLKVYNSARCHLNPSDWLDWCLSVNNVSGLTDASETIWGKYLISDLHDYLDLQIRSLSKCVLLAEKAEQMEKPVALMQSMINDLRKLRACSEWDEICANSSIDFGRLVFPKKNVDPIISAQIKAVRANCKKGIEKKLRRFSGTSSQILADINKSASAARGLVNILKKFNKAYDELKKSRHLLDFSDLEHKMLDLLLGKGRLSPTALAFEIASRFREILVDEYQDSNAVQDAIFSALSVKRQNCFMVGDVKQSIYQFRLADPGIFLEKYNSYIPAERAQPGQGRKISLSNNFRSCGAVIDAVNDVFSNCMSVKVGGLEYGHEEKLYEGVPHAALDEHEIEFYGIEVKEDTYKEEAMFTAKRISQLLDGTHMIRHGDGLRPITEEDIVILLRSPGSVGMDFCYALEQLGIRCSMASGEDLLQTEEVGTLHSILQIIKNPLQDIPLVSVLASRVFGFTADDLAAIRCLKRNDSFYEALKKDDSLKSKVFCDVLQRLRQEARISNLAQLIETVFRLTRIDSIYSSMPDGMSRVDNLREFYKFAVDYEAGGRHDLGQFIEYIQSLKARGISSSSEYNPSGSVTVMSIHKSKGLEFPVVFLCGLSREFNREDARAQVLCNNELGLGLSSVDTVNRVRYPTIAKRAISARVIAENLSEEMRVLYVAMTRAKDRLIMTYASKYLENEIQDIMLRAEVSEKDLLICEADCPGRWILMTALKRIEAGELIALGGCSIQAQVSDKPWLVRVVRDVSQADTVVQDISEEVFFDKQILDVLKEGLSFVYEHFAATKTPSKITATQLKGRRKDFEIAENTSDQIHTERKWRKPNGRDAFAGGQEYGTAVHAIMQHICFGACDSEISVSQEIKRLVCEGYITEEQGSIVDSKHIAAFFNTRIGKKVRNSNNVLREFKFSILDDAVRYGSELNGESVLVQGVVDCAIIEDDGIIVIDFKTDRVTEDTIDAVIHMYRAQVNAYADALSRIYELPVKQKYLYLFRLGRFVQI